MITDKPKSKFILLQDYRDEVNVYVNQLAKKLKKESRKFNNSLTNNYIEALANTVESGGKRLRPALMYYTYLLAGGKPNKEIIKISVFLEMLQSYLLIHDDIIDKASTRRGEKTTHIVYKEYAKKKRIPEADRYGEMIALLIGDIAGNYINKIVLESPISDKTKIELLSIITEKLDSVLVGQIEDLNLSLHKEFTEKDILAVHQDKTVTYTFELPILSGLILANNHNENLKNSLAKYAKYAGYAFQIRDDIIGMFGDPAKTGKPNDSDIKEGKKTHLLAEAYRKSTGKQKSILNKIIGNENATKEDIEKIRNVVIETGSLTYTQNLVSKNIKKARKTLMEIKSKSKDGYEFLDSILNILVEPIK